MAEGDGPVELTQRQINALREQLDRFGADAGPPEQAGPFLRFYGLDFSGSFPEAVLSMGWVPSGDYKIATYCWRQPDATDTLLLIHGYLDHAGLFAHLIRFGLMRGSNVLVFDLPGHGLSTGQPAAIDDFSQYSAPITAVLAASGLDQQPLRAIPQTTGGAA